MKKFIWVLLGISCGLSGFAQPIPLHPDRRNEFSGQWQEMYSTHDDVFSGGRIYWHRVISRRWSLGAGGGYSSTSLHTDNGWFLYHVHIWPVFADERWQGGGRHLKQIGWYLHGSEGISRLQYDKQLDIGAEPYRVHEYGLFLSAAAGCRYLFTRSLAIQLEAGLQSFHVSSRNLDVNPHGLVAGIGLSFYP